MFGFIRDLVSFQDVHSTTNVAFCFDAQNLKRKEVLPGYKSTRKLKRQEETKEEKKARQELMNQINTLRESFLKSIGFRNIFHADGYEADDIIASLCLNKPDTAEMIIISTDGDLLQLLTPDVSMWNPGNQIFTTMQDFIEAWGILPTMWPRVKAIAGCSTDDIRGVAGVGEKKAAQFLTGMMNKKTKTFANIIKSKELALSNLPLVQLPYAGCPTFKLKFDKIDSSVWSQVLSDYGMKSLRNSPPRLKRKGLHEES